MTDGSWLVADGRTPEQQVMGDPPSAITTRCRITARERQRSRTPRRSMGMAGTRMSREISAGHPSAISHQPSRHHQPSAISHFLLAGGYTFIELLVVSAIVMILASAVMPLVKVAATRQREAELRHALREMRTAIDKYKDAADTMQIGALEIKVGSEGYPPDLETLVEGVAANNDAT
jgi:type II secretory pathway pseudopilin PulG